MNKQATAIVVLVCVVALLSWLAPVQDSIPPDNIDVDDSMSLSESEAKEIAARTCVKGGEVLGGGMYNSNSRTWWFDANLNATRPGCFPACVVDEVTKKGEINWRCTGVVDPAVTSVQCTVQSRQGDVCPAIYAPVCATVNVQCIKAPCPAVQQTFPASCEACHNPLVSEYVPGECPSSGVK